MLYQGVDMPLLNLETIVDHGDGKQSEAVVYGGDESESRESRDLDESVKDLDESEKDDNEKTESQQKVQQNGNQEKSECVTSEMKTANTFVLDYKKAWKKRDAAAAAPKAPKIKQKVSACK